jgi:O-antigen/teichoic acid export membrane protein
MTSEDQSSLGAQVARGASYLFLQGAITSISNLLFLLIASRLLPISSIGAVSALGIVSSLLTIIGAFAIPSGVTKYISEYMGKNRQDTAKEIYKKTLRFSFLTSTIITMVSLALSAVISQYVFGDFSSQSIIVFLAFDIGVLTFYSLMNGTALGLQNFRLIAYVGIIVSALKLLIPICFLIIGLGLFGIVLGWFIGDSVGSLILLFFCSSSFGKAKSSNEFSFVELFRYSLPLYVVTIVGYFSTTIDRIVILSLSTLAALGIYSVAVAAVNVIGIVSSSIGSSLFPKFSHMYGRYGADSLKESSFRSSKYVFIIYTPLAIGLAATAYPIIELFFGVSYASGWLSLSIVSIAVALTSAGIIINNLLLCLGRTRIILEANVIGVLVGAVLSALLVPYLGSVGAAFGRASLVSASFAYSAYKLKRNYGLPIDIETLQKCLLCTLIMLAVIVPIELLLSDKYMTPFYIIIGGIVYILTLRLLKMINEQDMQLLEEILPERLRNVVRAFANFLVQNRTHDRETK